MRGEWDKKKDKWVRPLWLIIIFFSHGLSSRKMESTNTITTKPKRQYKRKAVEIKPVEIKPVEAPVEKQEIKPAEIPEIKPVETKPDFIEVVQ